MKPAVAYLRVSSLGQGAEGKDGLTRQLAAVESYARANGYELTKVYRDEISGTKDLENRPALLELLESADRSTVILIEKLDRLARSLMIQENLIADFQRRGVTLISAAEPDLDSTDPTRVLMRQIFGAIAQYDRAMICAKLRGARQRKKLRGEHAEGRYAYGCHPARYPEERAIAERIRAMRASGATLQAIAGVLNAEGVQPREGRCWWASSVRKVAG